MRLQSIPFDCQTERGRLWRLVAPACKAGTSLTNAPARAGARLRPPPCCARRDAIGLNLPAVAVLTSLLGAGALAGTTFHLNTGPAILDTQSLPGMPVDLAVNEVGDVFVVTSGNDIHSLSGTGVVLNTESLSGAGVPVAVTATPAGDVYVAKSSGVILRLNTGLSELASETVPGTPVDLTVDPAGTVFVVTSDSVIHKRTAALGPIDTATFTGTPRAVHADGTGNIFVATTTGIHRLNASLSVLDSGTVAGTPIDVTADAAGHTIVAASGGRLHRITDTITTLSSRTLAGSLIGVSIDDAGNVVSANAAGTVFVLNTGLSTDTQVDVGLSLAAVAINLVGDIYAVSGDTASTGPDVTVSTAVLGFLATVVGAGASGPTATFSVTHAGGGALSVTSTSSDPDIFEIVSGASFMLSSGSDDVTVRFRCPASGPQNGTITVSATDGTMTDVESVPASGNCYVPTPSACYTPMSALAFGQVDAGMSAFQTITVENCGTAPLVISSVSLSTTDSVWTGPTPDPSEPFPITLTNNGDKKNFKLTIDVPADLSADVGYGGTVTIVTNDGEKTLDVTATGHVPRAEIVINPIYWDIDFRDVELGFHFARPLVIQNDGDLALTFNVVRQGLIDADHGSFELETGADSASFMIGPGEARTFRQTFEPDSLGLKDIVIRVQDTNDPTFTFQDIELHGNGTPPTPIDSVLLLDRSGSMAESAGEGESKITRMRDAATVYVELLREGTDYLGLTRYDDENDNVLALGEVSAVRSSALTTLADIGPGGALEPDGRTGIGGAMRTAATQYALSPPVTSPDPAHKKVMIVLTDGQENEEPFIMQVIDGTSGEPGLFVEHPDLLSYSVGLGVAGNLNESRLQAITNRGEGGFYRVTGALTGLNVFALENFYFKIFADAIGQMLVVDPTFEVGLGESLEVPIGIITEDREALFFFIGELPETAYVFELIDPLGNIITSSSTVGGMSVQVKEKANWTFFRVKFPAPDIDRGYVGIWRFRVRIEDPEKWVRHFTGQFAHLDDAGPRHRMSFQASVGSNYRLAAWVGPEVVQTGDTIRLRAALTEGGWPSPRAKVRVTVHRPDGGVATTMLYDDGAHTDDELGDGVFGGAYVDTVLGGIYQFEFHSDGTTERGEEATRMATRSQFVGKPPPDPAPEKCIPCWMLRWIYVLVIVLLVAILALLWRRTG